MACAGIVPGRGTMANGTRTGVPGRGVPPRRGLDRIRSREENSERTPRHPMRRDGGRRPTGRGPRGALRCHGRCPRRRIEGAHAPACTAIRGPYACLIRLSLGSMVPLSRVPERPGGSRAFRRSRLPAARKQIARTRLRSGVGGMASPRPLDRDRVGSMEARPSCGAPGSTPATARWLRRFGCANRLRARLPDRRRA